MKLRHKLAYIFFNSKAGFDNEDDLRAFKITAFAKSVGCAEQIAEFIMVRRRVRAKLRGEINWRNYYD